MQQIQTLATREPYKKPCLIFLRPGFPVQGNSEVELMNIFFLMFVPISCKGKTGAGFLVRTFLFWTQVFACKPLYALVKVSLNARCILAFWESGSRYGSSTAAFFLAVCTVAMNAGIVLLGVKKPKNESRINHKKVSGYQPGLRLGAILGLITPRADRTKW